MTERVETDCVIAGGGPAGMMLGFLLARAGVRVTVLEKHADFLRDFRGDTIHPRRSRPCMNWGCSMRFGRGRLRRGAAGGADNRAARTRLTGTGDPSRRVDLPIGQGRHLDRTADQMLRDNGGVVGVRHGARHGL